MQHDASELRNLDRRSFLKMGSPMGLDLALHRSVLAAASSVQKRRANAAAGQITPEKIDPVRIGIVGVGVRGTEFVHILMNLKGNQVTAVCDIVPEKVSDAQRIVKQKGHPEPAGYSRGERDFERMCENQNLDLAIAAKPRLSLERVLCEEKNVVYCGCR